MGLSRRLLLCLLAGVLAWPAVARAAPPVAGTVRATSVIEVDAPASGTNRLDQLTVTGMASYTTQAYVKSLTTYFKLVPTTGGPPDGTTLINATDGRQWQIIASGGGGATGVTPGAYGDGQHVATYTVQSDGRLTLAASSTISIGSTAISDSTSLGRSLVTAASTAAAQSALSLVPGTNVQVYDSDLAAIAALATAADKCIYFTGSSAAALYTCTAAGRTWAGLADAAAQTAALNAFSSTLKGLVPASGGGSSNFLRADGTWAAPAGGGGGDMLAANNLSDLTNFVTARSNLGVAIGTNVQAQDAELQALAGLVSAADRLPYFTGSGTAALATYTSTARSWDALSTVAAETAALNNFTTSLAGMCPASGGGTTNFLRADGTWAAPSGGGITALTGDVTASGAGSVVATVANIPAGVTVAGKLVRTEIAAPATPSAGTVATWVDSTDARLHDKNPAGTIGTTVVSDTGATNNFLTAVSAAGVISKAQPAISNITAFSSSALATQITDETGTGLACFATNPTLTGATMAGRLNLGDNPIDCGSSYHSDGNKTGAAPSLADFSTTCNMHTWTLTGNVTGTPTWTIGGAKHFEVWVCQDATGSRTQTWPSSPTLQWVGGSAPTLQTAASACDVVDFTYNGTTIIGQAVASSGGSGITAGTGDVTFSGTGSVVTTNVNAPDGFTQAGKIIETEIAAPATPSVGKISIWADSTDTRFHDKNPAGQVGTTVVSSTAGANQFCTGVTVNGGVTFAQPSFSNLSGSGTCAQEPAMTGDATSSAGSCALTIAANAVTNAKMATMAATTVKMNNTGGSATPTDVTFGTALSALFTKGTTAASASNVDLTGASLFHISGTTTIATFTNGTQVGDHKWVVYDGALTLTNSANLILLTGANRTTAAGNVQELVYDGSGIWRETIFGAASAGGTTLDSITTSGTIASATTTNIGGTGNVRLTISGTTTIIGFDTVAAGILRFVTFSGALTLTHSSTSLILPNGVSILTTPGDTAIFISEGSGNWRCWDYRRSPTNWLARAIPDLPGFRMEQHTTNSSGSPAGDGWSLFSSGTASGSFGAGGTTISQFTCQTGTTTTGECQIDTNSQFFTAHGQIEITATNFSVNAASDGTNTYKSWMGISNFVSTTEPTAGVYFRTDTNANYQCVQRNASTETTADSGIAVGTTPHNLTIVINAAGTAATYYIDNVAVCGAIAATNLPSTSTGMQVFDAILKSAGTTARWFTYDRIRVDLRTGN